MSTTPIDLLRQWLAQRLDAAGRLWLDEQLVAVGGGAVRPLALAFGLAPRKVGKADLPLSAADLTAARDVRAGWQPVGWTVDQAVRTLLVLSFPAPELAAYVRVLDQLFAVGEVRELVALYQALPLLPHPAAHQARCAEGIRSNMLAVFTAVAHHNPYPAEQLAEGPWNQMVLKCLFVNVSLAAVSGLDRRANPALARMLTDFAHERWAARRDVNPELWRCVGPFADAEARADLWRLLHEGSPKEQRAAALALQACPDPEAASLLAQAPELAAALAGRTLTWDTL